MSEPLHTVLVPGLLCSARLYAEQLPALWRLGSFSIADHRRDSDLRGIARRLLAAAPPRFALVGLSMGGYIAFEFQKQHRDLLKADLAVTADGPMHPSGRPTVKLGSRGVISFDMRVKHANRDVHSGNFGGVVPNPL